MEIDNLCYCGDPSVAIARIFAVAGGLALAAIPSFTRAFVNKEPAFGISFASYVFHGLFCLATTVTCEILEYECTYSPPRAKLTPRYTCVRFNVGTHPRFWAAQRPTISKNGRGDPWCGEDREAQTRRRGQGSRERLSAPQAERSRNDRRLDDDEAHSRGTRAGVFDDGAKLVAYRNVVWSRPTFDLHLLFRTRHSRRRAQVCQDPTNRIESSAKSSLCVFPSHISLSYRLKNAAAFLVDSRTRLLSMGLPDILRTPAQGALSSSSGCLVHLLPSLFCWLGFRSYTKP